MRALLWGMGILAAMEACAFLLVSLLSVCKRKAEKSDCVIVPGARVMPDGTLSTALRFRADGCVKAVKEGLSDRVVVCGARGADEPCTEAEAIKEYLVLSGIPEKSIFTDANSFSTIENIRNAACIMRENGLHTALIVTSDYHLSRCLFLARLFGIRASGIPVCGGRRKKTRLMGRVRETVSWQLLLFRLVFHSSSIK